MSRTTVWGLENNEQRTHEIHEKGSKRDSTLVSYLFEEGVYIYNIVIMSISTMSVDLFTLKIYALGWTGPCFCWGAEREQSFAGVPVPLRCFLAACFSCWFRLGGLLGAVPGFLPVPDSISPLDFAISYRQCSFTTSCFPDHPTSIQVEWARAWAIAVSYFWLRL